MKRHSNRFLFFCAIPCLPALVQRQARRCRQRRLALVIGNASYKAQPLTNAVNDAALIAQTLQLAGFDVVGARDLDQGQLRAAFRDFTDKVARCGNGCRRLRILFRLWACSSPVRTTWSQSGRKFPMSRTCRLGPVSTLRTDACSGGLQSEVSLHRPRMPQGRGPLCSAWSGRWAGLDRTGIQHACRV